MYEARCWLLLPVIGRFHFNSRQQTGLFSCVVPLIIFLIVVDLSAIAGAMLPPAPQSETGAVANEQNDTAAWLASSTASDHKHRRAHTAFSRGHHLRQAGKGDWAANTVHAIQTAELRVCIMSADFWGVPASGGTATAYHLLADAIVSNTQNRVTFLGVSDVERCREAQNSTMLAGANIHFTCLEEHHFQPKVIETHPYARLAQAALKWLQEYQDKCDVVHAHEWGGVFTDIITAVHFRQADMERECLQQLLQLKHRASEVRNGIRTIVEPHGGHFWSSQGQMRPLDVVSLRIDNAERMANRLPDFYVSPTRYMLAYLQQRGWQLPSNSEIIPNVVPLSKQSDLARTVQKQIWKLAFFSRLDERKGLRIFVDAVSALKNTQLPDKFEVTIIGNEGNIDMVPSSIWLKEHTATWPWKTNMVVNASREEAFTILRTDGTLLVLCSLVENMPYILAESAIEGVPFVACDAGGILEMFDSKLHPDSVVKKPTSEALSMALDHVLGQGSIAPVQLREAIVSGRQQWREWHAYLSTQLPTFVREDEALTARAAQYSKQSFKTRATVTVVPVTPEQDAFSLWEPLCNKQQPASLQAILLLPQEFQFIDPVEGMLQLSMLTSINKQRSEAIGALAFGAILPQKEVSMPSSPTWILYAGDDQQCIDNVPVLISLSVFCSAFLAEAQVFRHYSAWVLAMLLNQQDVRMHTYPSPLFRISNFTTSGQSCVPSEAPKNRALSFDAASNLFRDSEELLRHIYVAPMPRPLACLNVDAPTHQKHNGWQFGFIDNTPAQFGYTEDDASEQVFWLSWQIADNASQWDGKWGCPDAGHNYPSFSKSLMHPCAGAAGNCCKGLARALSLLRFESFFHARNAYVSITYEVWPSCGDGLDVQVRSGISDGIQRQVLHEAHFEADVNGRAKRQKFHAHLDLAPGDVLEVVLDPRANHDCDGLYVADFQIWDNRPV